MYHSYSKPFLLVFLLGIMGATTAFAQKSNRENIPYTRFGMGDYRNGANGMLRGMGSISSAYSNENAINTDNPASYADFKLTVYEAGVEGSRSTVSNKGTTSPTGTFTLSHLTIGIPLGKNFGMVMGLQPYTRIYYNTVDTAEVSGLGPSIRGYTGDGGVNIGYMGFAGRYKGFSAGVNVGYMFGSINHASTLRNVYDTTNYFGSAFSQFTRVGDVYYKAGIMYTHSIHKDLGFRIGATYSGKQQISAKRDSYEYIFRSYPSSGIEVKDTAVSLQNVKGAHTIPSTITAGAQVFSGRNWAAGVDFFFANFKQYRNFGQVDSVANNTYKIAVGGEYTPNPTSLNSYLNRVTYRIGFYYGKDYVRLRNTDLNYYAVTVGASLPFRRSFDKVHMALEVGKRGTNTNGLIKQNFVKLSVGMSLNDRWFVKRKYD